MKNSAEGNVLCEEKRVVCQIGISGVVDVLAGLGACELETRDCA